MPRSHPFTSKHSTQNECVRIYGIFKRKKQLNDIPEVREHEICISEQGILVQRVLGADKLTVAALHIEYLTDFL